MLNPIVLIAGLAVALGAGPAVKPVETYRIPYQLTATKHVLVRAKINGKGPFHFIIDTGAPNLYVASEVAKQLGIKADGRGWATFERFDVEGGLKLGRLRGRVEDLFQLEGMNGLNLAGVRLHGIIGFAVLARFRLEFDFTRDHLNWTKLDRPPELLEETGGAAAPAGLEALGGLMKVMGGMLGKQAESPPKFRGFAGIEADERDNGVFVRSVLAGGPAAKAELRAGDRIESVAGEPIRSMAALRRALAPLTPGAAVALSIRRDGAARDIRIVMGDGL